MPDFRAQEMREYFGYFRENVVIAHDGEFLDFLEMPFNELYMREEGFEIRPAGKGFGMDHQPRQFSVFGNVGVDLAAQGHKIGRFERRCGLKNEYPFR